MRLPSVSLAAAALLVTGCFGTSPPSRFYVLSASPEARAAVPSTGPDGTLGVFPTRVADYLDRPQIVTFLGDNTVDIDEYDRWAEPLGAGVTRVLAQELSALLPGWRVVPQAWDPVIPARAGVTVTVTALGWNETGEARLDATWAVLAPAGDKALARGRAVLREQARAKDPAATAAAASALVSALAREIAVAVRALPPPG